MRVSHGPAPDANSGGHLTRTPWKLGRDTITSDGHVRLGRVTATMALLPCADAAAAAHFFWSALGGDRSIR